LQLCQLLLLLLLLLLHLFCDKCRHNEWSSTIGAAGTQQQQQKYIAAQLLTCMAQNGVNTRLCAVQCV
jgi:hypothetical protein